MVSAGDFFQYLFPFLVVLIAVVMMCFYLHVKKTRASYDFTTARHEGAVPAATHPFSLPDYQTDDNVTHQMFPPDYSSLDEPPPYSLIDPKLTTIWPDDPPPSYEMFTISLPLDSHHSQTPVRPSTPQPPPCGQASPC